MGKRRFVRESLQSGFSFCFSKDIVKLGYLFRSLIEEKDQIILTEMFLLEKN